MKIALAVRDLRSLSGVSILVKELAGQLSKLGQDVVLLSNRLPHEPAGLKVQKVGIMPFPSIARAWSFDRGACKSASALRADVLHGHGDLSAQDVLTVNNVDAAEAHFTGRKKIGSPGTQYVRKRQWHPERVRRIVAVSEQVKADLHKFYGVESDRISVIYWGVDTSRFSPGDRDAARAELRRTLGLKPSARIFLSLISGDVERRNMTGLLETFERAPLLADDVLLVVGDPHVGHYPGAKDLMNTGRLKTLPKSAHPEQVYRGADAFILPAHYETFGMTALEAMATALPVIVTARCGAAELVVDGENGLIVKDSRSPNELARAIARLARESELGRRMGEAALATARAHSSERSAKDYLALYREITQAKHGGAK